MADIEAIRAKLAALSPEQRAELDDILKGQLGGPGAGKGDLYRPESSGSAFTDAAIAGMGAPSASSLEEAGSNLLTGASIMAAPGAVSGVTSPLAAAASRGVGAIPGALMRTVGRGAVGAGAGAVVGSLPFIGTGPVEGAKLGALMALGEGGTGALWKHGKRKGAIEWLMGKVGVEPAKKAARKGAEAIARDVAEAGTMARVGQAVPRSARRATEAAKALSADEQRMVLQLQQQMGTEEGKAAIRELLASQPPQIQEQIKNLLARGISQPATTRSGLARSVNKGPSIPPEYTSELAKLLGQ